MTRRLDNEAADTIADHMRGFLRSGVTGCAFARAHAKEATGALIYDVHVGPLDDAIAVEVESFFDGAADEGAAGIVVLPELRTADDICAVLALLGKRPRWEISEQPWKTHERADVLVGVDFQTALGANTSVMGLAPLGSMPAMRRAPYVALAAWTGPLANDFWTTPTPGRVGLVNMPLPGTWTADAYKKVYDATKKDVRDLKRTLGEGAARPDVAFCLPTSCRERLDPIWSAR